ncbi:hypothetical protein GOODEAATRI_001208, partial [Goodea atripinnis]
MHSLFKLLLDLQRSSQIMCLMGPKADCPGEDLSFLLDSKAFGQQQCVVDSSYPEPPKAPNLYDTKGATDAGLLNLDSHQDFNWWTSYPH